VYNHVDIRGGKKLQPFTRWRKKYLSLEKNKKNRPGGGNHAAPRQVKKKLNSSISVR
jgi:hypothetical protein